VSPSKGATSERPVTATKTGPAFTENTQRLLDLSVRKKLILFLSLGVLATESLHATGGVNQLLFARKERMALGADFHVDDFVG
jgi:hypothetical protein